MPSAACLIPSSSLRRCRQPEGIATNFLQIAWARRSLHTFKGQRDVETRNAKPGSQAEMTSVLTENLAAAPTTFWRWWISELKGLVPNPYRASSQAKKPYLLLEIRSETLALHACTRRHDTELARSDGSVDEVLKSLANRRFRRWPIVIRLDHSLGLTKQVDLPRVPIQDIASLISFELDRITPLEADNAYVAWRIMHENKKERRMQVLLEAAPKDRIEPAINAIQRHGRVPARLELGDDGKYVPLDLLQFDQRQSPTKRTRPSLLPPLILGLLIIAGALPLRQQTVMVEQLRAEVERSREKAEDGAALRERLASHAAERLFLLNQRDERLAVTEVLQALTTITLDKSYIRRLDVREAQMTIVGKAEKVSDLLKALERSPIFNAARLQSPVTIDPDTKRETFEITAEITNIAP